MSALTKIITVDVLREEYRSMSIAQIAAKYGVKREDVRYALRWNGIKNEKSKEQYNAINSAQKLGKKQPNKKRKKFICSECGKEFDKYRGKSRKHTFCSWECRNTFLKKNPEKLGAFSVGHEIKEEWKMAARLANIGKKRSVSTQFKGGPRPLSEKTGEIVLCEVYNKPFYRTKCRPNNRYCSRECADVGLIGSVAWNRELKGWNAKDKHWAWGKPNLKFKGENNPNWKGGRGLNKRNFNVGIEYAHWRHEVFKRDGYKCAECGNVGTYLNAHHIISYANEDTRYDINNGVTLCRPCHYMVHSKRNVNKKYIGCAEEGVILRVS